MTGVGDVQFCWAFGQRLRDGEGRDFTLVVECDSGDLRLASGGDGDFMEVDFDPVERDAGAGPGEMQVDGFVSVEGAV